MSANPSSVSPETLEQTKQQIRGLINEISELSRSDMPADQFYPAVLQRIVNALAAVGGAVWLLDSQQQLRLTNQIKVSQSLLDPETDDAQKHMRLLGRLLSQGKSDLVMPMTTFGEDQSAGNPTPFLLVFAPLILNKSVVGLIEIFQRADSPPATQRGYLKFLEQMCKLVGEWLKSQTLTRVADRQQLWQQADHFARLVHDNLDLRETAFTVSNEGRRLIECDRVSVAIKKGNKCKVLAISGQDTIENRSNIVTALNLLATRVVAAGESLWYDGSTEDLPPQLEEAVEDYVDLSHGRTVSILPIRRPERQVEGDVNSKNPGEPSDSSRREIIGALIVEQIETQLSSETLQSRVDLVYEHSCRALSNSMSHSNLFLMPVWRTLDRATWLFRGSALPKTATVLALLTIATIAMFIIPINLDLEANGELQPSVQRQVFAHVDGEVDEVLVKHGQEVKAGEPVAILRNRDLEVQIANLRGQLEQVGKQLDRVNWELTSSRTLAPEQESRLAGERGEYSQQQISLIEQLSLLDEKRKQLVRTSPIDGTVVTWDVERNLRLRPVVTGQVLMTIAARNSEWEIELKMPEKRMRYIDAARKELNGEPIPVEFILMTDTGVTRTGKLYPDAIQNRTEMDEEEGATVRLRVVPDSIEGETQRAGARVIADVTCGRRSAAFVWFHEAVEWVQANVFF